MTGRRVNLAGKCVQQDWKANRRTGEAVREPEKSGSGPDLTVRLAGVRPQRHIGLCPRTAVHSLISDGSKLFWSKIISQKQGPADWQVFSQWSHQKCNPWRVECVRLCVCPSVLIKVETCVTGEMKHGSSYIVALQILFMPIWGSSSAEAHKHHSCWALPQQFVKSEKVVQLLKTLLKPMYIFQ